MDIETQGTNDNINQNLNIDDTNLELNQILIQESLQFLTSRIKSDVKCKQYQLGPEQFFISERYRPVEFIGSGAYGSVITAIDTGREEKREVAIKKLKNISDIFDLKRVLREILIMKYAEHENIVPLYDVIFHYNTNKEEKKICDVYLVMEKLDGDLQKIIVSKQELSDEHYQFILFQILRALLYLHSANIIHRDFKPSNVLINEDCTVKLCDFGMSRGLKETSEQNNAQLTEYVVTRFYRAPEIMLSSHHYSKKIDVWSVGCTFAELISKKILFPGQNYVKQIELIIELLGSPAKEDLEFISNSSAKNFVMELKNKPKIDFNKMFKYSNKNAINLLEKMIVFNPNKRISIEEALQHKYLQAISEGIENPIFSGTIDFEFDYNKDITTKDLLEKLVNEVSAYDTWSS